MTIKARWDRTETTVHGEQTEVVLPLAGLGEVHPAEDKLLTQILRDALPSGEDQPLWQRIKLDREDCRLHLLLGAQPNVAEIKSVLDRALSDVSHTITENMAERARAEADARAREQQRQRQAADLRRAFRCR